MRRACFSSRTWAPILAILLAACSPQEKSAKVLIELPEPTAAQRSATPSASISLSGGWTKELSTQDDVFCYALLIGAPDFKGTRCVDDDSTVVADVGSLHGTYPAGGTLEISATAGKDRTLYLVGLNAESLSQCANFRLDGSTQAGYSRPHILAKTTLDLVPGDNQVTMVTQVAGSTSFERCLASDDSVPDEPPLPPSIFAVISDFPNSPSNQTELDISVSGQGVDKYRYKILSGSPDCTDPDGYSEEVSNSEKIAVNIGPSGLNFADGLVGLCVVGGSAAGVWQSFDQATEYHWTKDTDPPGEASVVINYGDGYTNSKNVTLSLLAPGASKMYLTNDEDCGGTESWENFVSSRSWELGQTNGTAKVYFKTRDEAGNESNCASETIVHDSQNPNDPSGLTLGSVPPSTTSAPTITFVDEGDNGPAGIDRFQIQIYRADHTLLEAWQDFTSGSTVGSLDLDDGQQYYAKIRAVDKAGNVSAGVDTDTWTVAGALLAVINDAPEDPSVDEVLDVTISGTNIVEYRFKVGEAGTTVCADSSGYSVTAIPVGTKITDDISGLDDGNITLCVVGSNGDTWQSFADASSYTWEKDTTPPSGISIAINNGDSHTNNDSVTLTLVANDVAEMLITNTAGCSAGSYESFDTSKSWTLGQANGTATVYAKFRDDLGNESECISATIVHDGIKPQLIVTLDTNQRHDTHDSIIKFIVQSTEPLEGLEGVDWYNSGSAVVAWQVIELSPAYFILEADVSSYGTVTPQLNLCGASDSAGNCAELSALETVTRHEIRFSQITAGSYHTCGVTDVVGVVACWGDNEFGKLGDGNDWESLVPIQVHLPTHQKYTAVVAGAEHTCALSEFGNTYCWGQNGSGQSGPTAFGGIVPPQEVPGPQFKRLFGGYFHNCGLTINDDAYCWGENSAGQLGINSTMEDGVPTAVYGSYKFLTLSMGNEHTCGVTSSFDLYCWGSNAAGQFGTGGTPASSTVPYYVMADAHAVSTGHNHTCYLNDSGGIKCWGENNMGQLGNDSATNSTVPVNLYGALPSFDSIAVGGNHSCALSVLIPFCWGFNSSGQLGVTDETDRLSPVAVTGGHSFTSIVGGDLHSCALDPTGNVFCWGENSLGQLGLGHNSSVSAPSPISLSGP